MQFFVDPERPEVVEESGFYVLGFHLAENGKIIVSMMKEGDSLGFTPLHEFSEHELLLVSLNRFEYEGNKTIGLIREYTEKDD